MAKQHLEPEFTDVEREFIVAQDLSLGRLLAVWTVILTRHNKTLDDFAESELAPWDFAIPYDDAVWACERVMDAETDPIAKSQRALDWANKGPSYYQVKERTP